MPATVFQHIYKNKKNDTNSVLTCKFVGSVPKCYKSTKAHLDIYGENKLTSETILHA